MNPVTSRKANALPVVRNPMRLSLRMADALIVSKPRGSMMKP